MDSTLLAISEYKLTDLLGAASATIGIIIAGTIFLQFLSSKYVELAGRFRELAAEYRRGKTEEPRHAPLRAQLWVYRRRLTLLKWASWLGAVALISFLLSVLAGGLSMLEPEMRIIRAVGTGGLFLGLLLIAGAVLLELVESVHAGKEIHEEVADLDDEAKNCPRTHLV